MVSSYKRRQRFQRSELESVELKLELALYFGIETAFPNSIHHRARIIALTPLFIS